MYNERNQGRKHKYFDVLDFLQREPVMLRALQETVEFETSLTTRLEKAERRLEEFEGRNAHEEMEEGPVPQEREFNEGEAVYAPLSENDNEAENWPSGAESPLEQRPFCLMMMKKSQWR
ncbi:unnamed protein product [Brugia pahangi]|uniref:Uncharacterized protein n=1 Tax=Brugia pahangi TaxID=6280 RepID=A0A0N4T3Y7_BRUPA|nr:unnamed protein product [Brugia pahangi]